MKRCPQCNRTFTDPNLSFCIEDGAPLQSSEGGLWGSERATEAFPGSKPTEYAPPRPTERAPGSFPNAPPRPQPYGWANDSPPQVWHPPPPPARPTNQQQTLAVASMVLGLLGISFGWICGGPVFAIFAVILGAVAMMQIKSNPTQYTGRPFALVGLITGGLVLLFNLALMFIWIIVMIIGAMSQ
jgi:Domain of unknown function (DUF4190)